MGRRGGGGGRGRGSYSRAAVVADAGGGVGCSRQGSYTDRSHTPRGSL